LDEIPDGIIDGILDGILYGTMDGVTDGNADGVIHAQNSTNLHSVHPYFVVPLLRTKGTISSDPHFGQDVPVVIYSSCSGNTTSRREAIDSQVRAASGISLSL
jgi:hypothetical protein